MASDKSNICQRAKSIPRAKRAEFIAEIPEVELHRHLKELYQAMEPNYLIEVTHGSREKGKDLIIVKRDKFESDVIGVVVKTGNIKATTAGDVDEVKGEVKDILNAKSYKVFNEIASQVEQARAHATELRTLLDSLKISKVWVVISGEFSNSARERLQKEFAGTAIYDLDWLVEHFTEHYPQIFYQGRVIDFIEQKISELETKFSLSKKGINLSDYFVEPIVSRTDDSFKIDAKSLDVTLESQKINLSQLRPLLGGTGEMFLIGDPGSGKSGSLAKLSIDLLKQAATETERSEKRGKIPAPLIVTAAEILHTPSFEELAAKYFTAPEIQDRFTVNCLVVDGLDEVHADKRQDVIDKSRLYRTQLKSSLVISSRKIDITNKLPHGFAKYELLHLGIGQAFRLIENITANRDVLKALKSGLDNIKYQIPMIPLSLMMLVDLVEEHKEIPASITELYDRYYDATLGKYDVKKGITVLFDYLIKKRFVSALAYHEFFQKNRLEIPITDYDGFLKSYATKYSIANTLGFQKELERAGILDFRDQVFFKHRSILDYFAALYIHDHREEIADLDAEIAKLYFSDLWDEVAFFYIGLKRELPEKLMGAILDYATEDGGDLTAKYVIGKLLQAGWHSEAATKRSGIEKGLSYAPIVRAKMIEAAISADPNFPRFIPDILLIGAAEVAYRSAFLSEQVVQILTEKVATADIGLLEKCILLYAGHDFLKPTQISAFTTSIENDAKGLNAEDSGRALLMLLFIRKDNPSAVKSIKAKIKRLMGSSPDAFKRLFPARKPGQRQIPTKSHTRK